jgi:cephalosporin hydroxylase
MAKNGNRRVEGNRPKAAVREYLRTHPEVANDALVDHKLLISVAPGGSLRRVC